MVAVQNLRHIMFKQQNYIKFLSVLIEIVFNMLFCNHDVVLVLCDTDLFRVQLLYDNYWTLEMCMYVCIMHFCWCHYDYIRIYIHLQSIHASVSSIGIWI